MAGSGITAKSAGGTVSASMGAFEGCVESAVGVEFVSTVGREPTLGIVEELRFVYTIGTNTSVLSDERTTRCSWPEGPNRGFDTGMTQCFD
uniref:Uncharacterized protein n=1 Tax=Chromera velia CCMP2878 TaxID=1169474 RepID=A0A0G4HZB9_9ALVE|eukprot:Cvel_9676.t1-p1 / transcript=Cvel_9676.t1 / gene=Cvel_9676 / organism=Chromera_velia_CCMP2878 / gene_product=hypothetical protein / transcript_product=hypothetical protein / location=Cvel_scaffold563:69834-70103(-) / protein_length=90 / sequence_SO=supercontig / SO=protein_coding / is_pseudo=false